MSANRRGGRGRKDGPAARQGRPGRPPRGGRKGRPGRPDDDIVKGRHAVEALLRHAPDRIRALYLWGRDRQAMAALAQTAEAAGVTAQTRPPSEQLGGDHLAQGIAARVHPFVYAELEALIAVEAPLLLVLDSITDARNLGAILRSAAFFGVTGVILPADRASGVTGAVERIARGASASVPIARVTNLARTIGKLEDAGIPCAATVLSDTASPLTPASLRPPIAIVLGGEEKGVRRLVAQRCSTHVVLPAHGPMQSLNVASFASIALAFARSG